MAASRFKKNAVFKNCEFWKRARNTQAKYRRKDMSEPTSSPAAAHRITEPTQSLCTVWACLAPISPQSPHMVLAPSGLVFPPSAHRALCYSMLYIKTEKKTKSADKNFTWLRLVSKKMRFSKIANFGNAPAILKQNIVVKTCQSPPAAQQQPTESQNPHRAFAPSGLV